MFRQNKESKHGSTARTEWVGDVDLSKNETGGTGSEADGKNHDTTDLIIRLVAWRRRSS